MSDDTLARNRTLHWVRATTRWLRADEFDPVQQEAWKQAGQVFSVVHEGVELFPGYRFTGGEGQWQPRPSIRLVLEALGPVDHTWFFASWFLGANVWLVERGDENARTLSPEEALLRGLDDQVVQAARRSWKSYEHVGVR